MDSEKRPRRYSILLKVFFSLVACSILYFIVFRPIRVELNTRFLVPALMSFSEPYSDIIKFDQGSIMIKPRGYNHSYDFIIPFGIFFWVPFSIFIAIRNKDAIIFICLYHLFLSVLLPILAIMFIKDVQWSGILLSLNNTLFHILFLIALFIGLKGTMEEWSQGR